jgi:hypothetical protein
MPQEFISRLIRPASSFAVVGRPLVVLECRRSVVCDHGDLPSHDFHIRKQPTIVRSCNGHEKIPSPPNWSPRPLPATRTPCGTLVSTQLRAGTDPAQVAEWAGHSVEILFRIYAKCLDGGEAEMFRRIEIAFGHRSTPAGLGHVFGTDGRSWPVTVGRLWT